MDNNDTNARFVDAVVASLEDLKAAREEERGKSFTQGELEELTGISQAQISRIFSKKRKISVEQLYALAYGLGSTASAVARKAEQRITEADNVTPFPAPVEEDLTYNPLTDAAMSAPYDPEKGYEQ